ncbi:hypothetical protein ACQ9BO_26675 [Flavobacterium sp. P21]|uniref:hypothetical protein n=1 Tax=Flavobacterium sp. P21 TaxID=3423948 RepID=UPI003D66705E
MKTQNINWGYFFKHWIFTLIIGPIIAQIISLLALLLNYQSVGLLEMFPIIFVVSIIFSIPTYIAYAFVYHHFSSKNTSSLTLKIILISLTIIGIFITTAFIEGNISYFIALSYSISSIISGLVFDLKYRPEE